jgi:hypothetical protein
VVGRHREDGRQEGVEEVNPQKKGAGDTLDKRSILTRPEDVRFPSGGYIVAEAMAFHMQATRQLFPCRRGGLSCLLTGASPLHTEQKRSGG